MLSRHTGTRRKLLLHVLAHLRVSQSLWADISYCQPFGQIWSDPLAPQRTILHCEPPQPRKLRIQGQGGPVGSSCGCCACYANAAFIIGASRNQHHWKMAPFDTPLMTSFHVLPVLLVGPVNGLQPGQSDELEAGWGKRGWTRDPSIPIFHTPRFVKPVLSRLLPVFRFFKQAFGPVLAKPRVSTPRPCPQGLALV